MYINDVYIYIYIYIYMCVGGGSGKCFMQTVLRNFELIIFSDRLLRIAITILKFCELVKIYFSKKN